MSAEILSLVLSSDLTPGERLTIAALANYSNADGCCWPAQETLAKSTGTTRETVNRHLKSLEKKGFLEIKHRKDKGGRTSNLYSIKTSNFRKEGEG
jgi:DNA-binding MarR family transcriptional regulator